MQVKILQNVFEAKILAIVGKNILLSKPCDITKYLQSWTKYLRQTLDFILNRALREKNFYFLVLSC